MRHLSLLVAATIALSGLVTSAYAVCSVTACQEKVPSENGTIEERCRLAKEAIDCAQNNILSNIECSENVKMYVREKIAAGKKNMEEQCTEEKKKDGGAAGVMSSLGLCLAAASLTCLVISYK